MAEKTVDISVATGVHTWNATKYVAGITSDVSVSAYRSIYPATKVSLDNYYLKIPINEMEFNGYKYYIPNYNLECQDLNTS